MIRCLVTALLACLSALAHAGQDIPGAKDHPLFARYPQSVITEYKQQKSTVKFKVNVPGPAVEEVSVEGQATFFRYAHGKTPEPIPNLVTWHFGNQASSVKPENVYYRAPAPLQDDGGETTLKLVADGRLNWVKVEPQCCFGAEKKGYLLTIVEAPLPAAAAPAPAPARPANPPPKSTGGHDSRVFADKRVVALIAKVRATVPTGFTDASAKEVVTILLEDGRLDLAEYDLLDELTQPKIRAITIWASAGEETVMVGTQSGTVHKVLSEPLDNEARKLLGDSPTQANWAALVDRYEHSPSSAARTVTALQGLIAANWERSSMSDAYEAYSKMVTKLFDLSKALPAEKQKSARWLLNRACTQHDRLLKDQVPDFLYNWVKPSPNS
jgi:hypothetical protein